VPGSYEAYRPQECPANKHNTDDAGDAVGILRRVVRTSLFFCGLLTDRDPFKAALNAFVAEEQAFGALGSDDALKPLKQLLHSSSPG
jgi:hypothetical protein